MVNHLKTIIFLVFLFTFHVVHGDERILHFHSDITVHDDGSMEVKESLSVTAEQDEIKSGIYRDFPTTYQDRFGNRYKVDFEPVSVSRDGNPENFLTNKLYKCVMT